MQTFSTLDLVIFIAYACLILFTGLFVSRTRRGADKDSQDYFLAGKSLSWWAIGASIIASNISAEQFIGMSGSGFAIGLGIASYEFIAAATLIVVAVFFLPIYLRSNIYTMPQFLEMRYDKRVKTIMAFFWLLVFIFVNLTSILYLGSLAINKIMGIDMFWSIVGLALFAGIYSIYGGLKAVALTDFIQVVFLIGGGLLTTYVALDYYSGGEGALAGFSQLLQQVPEKFDLILDKDDPNYIYLPGVGVILGGLWVSSLYYFGCNQYIIQRALAAKSLPEAQLGLVFAGLLKIILPLIVVIPGIVAFAMDAPIDKPDQAYPWLMHNFIPTGIKGIAFAALVAAVVSSLASMINSISTIFTMDIYKEYLAKAPSEKTLVRVGRLFGVLSLVVAVFILNIILFVPFGILWTLYHDRMSFKRTLCAGFVFSLLMRVFLPEVSFIDRMGYVFLLCAATMFLLGWLKKPADASKAIVIDPALFRTTRLFKGLSILIMVILSTIYYIFW